MIGRVVILGGGFIGQVKDIITVGEFYDLPAGGQIIFT